MCNSNFVKIENSRSVAKAGGGGGGGGRTLHLPDPNKFILPRTEHMPLLMLCFKLRAWRTLRFILFLCRKRVPHHNFSFHKMAHLAATFSKKPVSSHFSTDIKTLNIVETLNWVSFDATVSLDFPCHGSKHVLPTESKPIVLSICNPFYNLKPVTDQSTTKRL